MVSPSGVRWAARSRLAESRAYLPVARRIHGSRVVGRDTELVIDGFTRSGVTFALMAFQLAQDRPVRVAHHLHAPSHLAAAVRRGLPALVVVRDPEEAVCSALVREPGVTAAAVLRAYARFHDRLRPIRTRLVVAGFEEVTGTFGAVIRRVNQRYGTAFREFDGGPGSVEEVFAIIEDRACGPPWSRELGRFEDGLMGIEAYRESVRRGGGREALGPPPESRVPRPSRAREAMKDEVRVRVRREVGLLARACRAHREFLAGAEGPASGVETITEARGV